MQIFGPFVFVAIPLAVFFIALKLAAASQKRGEREAAAAYLRDVRTDHLIWAEMLEDRERKFVIDDVVGTPEYHRDQADKLRLCIEALGYEGIPHA